MPEFQAREPEHQKWKQAVLSGEIELAPVETNAHNMRSLQAPSS